MEDAPVHGLSRVVGPLRTKIGPNIKEHLLDLNKSRDLPFDIIVQGPLMDRIVTKCLFSQKASGSLTLALQNQ